MAFVSVVLFLMGASWFIELGGLDSEQLQYLNGNPDFKHIHQNTTEYLGQHVVRLEVNIPNSLQAPPVAAVIPLLDAFSMMGFTLLSHNDEQRPNKNMVYLTWILQRDYMPDTNTTASETDE